MTREDLLRGLEVWRVERRKMARSQRQSIYKNQRNFVVVPGETVQIEPLTALAQTMKAAGMPGLTEARLRAIGAKLVSVDDAGFERLAELWEARVREEGTTPSERKIDPTWRPPKFFVLR